jgi:ABC-type multidrug transport system fused ATPase/permease subunit
MVSVALLVASVTKSVMLQERSGGLRSSCVLLCVASAVCLIVAAVAQCAREAHRRRRARELRPLCDADAAAREHGGGESCAAAEELELDSDSRDALATIERASRRSAGNGASMGRLLSLARPERPMLFVATLALLCSTASQMAMPALIGSLVTVVTQPSQTDPHGELLRVTLELLGIFAAGALFSFWRGYLFTLAGERVVARLRKALFRHLLTLEVGFFDATNTGELLNRLSSDTSVLQNAVTVNVSMGMRFAAQVFIALLLVFLLQPKLTLVMLSVVPVIALSATCYARFIKRIAKEYQARLADASIVAQESLGAVRTVRSFAKEDKESGRYASAVNASYVQGSKRALAYGAFVGAIGLTGQCAVVLVLWYGGSLVINDRGRPGGFDVGKLMSFLLYTITLAFALGGLSVGFRHDRLSSCPGLPEHVLGATSEVACLRRPRLL